MPLCDFKPEPSPSHVRHDIWQEYCFPRKHLFCASSQIFLQEDCSPHHRLKEWCHPSPTLYSFILFNFLPVSLELLNVMLRVCLLTIHFPYQTGNHLRLKTLFCTSPEPELHKCSGITDSQTLEKIEASQGVHIVTGDRWVFSLSENLLLVERLVKGKRVFGRYISHRKLPAGILLT